MAKIEIPEELIKNIGPSIAMDIHFIDVKLFDGRVFKKLVVRGGRYITGFKSAPNGESNLDFDTSNIKKVRPSSILPFF